MKRSSTYFAEIIFDRRCSRREPINDTESMKHGNRRPGLQWPLKSESKIIKTKTKRTSQSGDCNQLTEIFKGHRTTKRLVFTPSPVRLACHWSPHQVEGRSPSPTALLFYFPNIAGLYQFSANMKYKLDWQHFTLHYSNHINFITIFNLKN